MDTSLKAYLAVCNEPDRSSCVCLQSDETRHHFALREIRESDARWRGVSERDGESDSGNQGEAFSAAFF
ncbi:hypothetical protein AXF42_Ash021507 [Apostasia shenzhenica]|uniref:Uncharacterized protein n=1 Tax=Apostasia shenzhenica TaxID=1088818 RepID=A0A2H9ZSS9_9ASPA|nr:hypothetical protein AXF42_Ash021507 [Apostasia shenzhenica]